MLQMSRLQHFLSVRRFIVHDCVCLFVDIFAQLRCIWPPNMKMLRKSRPTYLQLWTCLMVGFIVEYRKYSRHLFFGHRSKRFSSPFKTTILLQVFSPQQSPNILHVQWEKVIRLTERIRSECADCQHAHSIIVVETCFVGKLFYCASEEIIY